MGEKTTKPLERRQMKFDKRSSTISSERGIMQISIAAALLHTGTAYLVTRSDGSIYTFGNGAIVSKTGNGTLIYTFDAIGHYLQDGKLHDTGHVIIKSTLRNLASFSDKIGLYKDWYDKSGNGMTTMWFWKG
jgi:hypothetical protein